MVKAAVTAAALAWLSFSCTALVAPSLRRSNAVRAGFAGKAASRSKRSGTISMYWHVFPRDYSDSNFLDDGRTYEGTILTKEYHIEPGESRNLGREDLGTYAYQSPNVDEVQCILQVAEDGSAVYAYAQGRTPTGWRTRPDEPWRWMQPGESTTLQSGWKVSLDCNNPESAVYKMEKAGRFLVEDYINSVNGVGTVDLRRTGVGGGGGGGLPPGWSAQVDPQSGQTYYSNQNTGETSWDPPQY